MAKIKGRMTREGLLDVLILKASKAPELGGLGIVITDRSALNELIGSHVATVKGAWKKLESSSKRSLKKLTITPEPKREPQPDEAQADTPAA